MAKKSKSSDPIDGGVRDSTEVSREREVTSSDGKFSTYAVAPKKNPLDGDLILQQRGKPSK